jgi:two-component sensor histidine kinase
MQQDRRALDAMSDDVDPEPVLQLSLAVGPDAASMRQIRSHLDASLERWQVEPRVANAVLDVAHELLVNAHQHAVSPVQLTVTAGTTDIRVGVTDASRDPARLLPYRPGLSEHGLGLHLVRQLPHDWGQTSTDEGKTVWAVFLRRASRTT